MMLSRQIILVAASMLLVGQLVATSMADRHDVSHNESATTFMRDETPSSPLNTIEATTMTTTMAKSSNSTPSMANVNVTSGNWFSGWFEKKKYEEEQNKRPFSSLPLSTQFVNWLFGKAPWQQKKDDKEK